MSRTSISALAIALSGSLFPAFERPAWGCTTHADCDDSNICTDDFCVFGLCEQHGNSDPCDDGLFCTATDTCLGGACVGWGDPCLGQLCDEGMDRCCGCFTAADCDDCNSCTDDTCIDCKCQMTPNTDPCDDSDLCTENDTCMGGLCVGMVVDCSALDDQCNVGTCDPGTGLCEATPANEGGPCDDDDVCTENDTCNAGVCAGTLAGDCCYSDADCNDAMFCNGQETCDGELCQPGTAPCLSSEVCDEVRDICIPEPVPAVSEWGMLVMTLLLLGIGLVVFNRRRATPS